MKKTIALLVACLLLLGLCACSGEPSLVGTADTPNTNSNNATEAEEKVFKVGDSVELDDIVVTFVDVTESKGSSYNKPEEGNIFVLCEFEIVNNSTKELNVSSMLSFEAYYDDYSCDTSFSALMEKGNKDQLDGTVAAGKKMKGVVGYEIPSDWKELEVQYTSDILSGSKIVFVATNG